MHSKEVYKMYIYISNIQVEEKINKEKEPGSPTDKLPLVDTKANTKKASTKANTPFPPDDR